MVGAIDIVVILGCIAALATLVVAGTILGCVVPRERKYSSGVCVRKKEDDEPQQRRKGVYSIFQNIGNLMRDRRASDSARIAGTHGTVEDEIDASLDRAELFRNSRSSARTMAVSGGSLRWRGSRSSRRRAEYREVPLEPPSCLAFKYGAPDGVRKPQLPPIYEPQEVAFADASYGATYKLPAPVVFGGSEDNC